MSELGKLGTFLGRAMSLLTDLKRLTWRALHASWVGGASWAERVQSMCCGKGERPAGCCPTPRAAGTPTTQPACAARLWPVCIAPQPTLCSNPPPPESYSLLSNNCNNFSDELAELLCGRGIPQHITGGVGGGVAAGRRGFGRLARACAVVLLLNVVA